MTCIITIFPIALLLVLTLCLAANEQAKGRAAGGRKAQDIMEAEYKPVEEPAVRPTVAAQSSQDQPLWEVGGPTDIQQRSNRRRR